MLSYSFSLLQRFAFNLSLETLLYNARYELKSGVMTPKKQKDGFILPNVIYIETSSRCKKNCLDCYVPNEDKKKEIILQKKNIDDVIVTAKKIGVNYISIFGGEPFEGKTAEINIEMMETNPQLRFVGCTSANGLSDFAVMNRLKKLKNLSLAFSIDGFEYNNDVIRGKDSFSKSIAALENYSKSGNIAGCMITLRSQNICEVTSYDFLSYLTKKGCYYFEISPYYTKDSSHNITPEEYSNAILELISVSKKIPSLIFSNHYGQLKDECVNLRRRPHSINVDYNGNVYTARRGKIFGNINEKPLIEIIKDKPFQDLFFAKHYNYEWDMVGETDSRYKSLISDTLDLMIKSGIYVKK